MNKQKIFTLILLSFVLALAGSIVIVSGMLDDQSDSPVALVDDKKEESKNKEGKPDVLGFTSTTEETEEEPIIEEEQPEETETKEELFDTFVSDEAEPTAVPTQIPTPVETMPQAGILDDYSKYFLILAPILIIGALLL